MERRERVSMTEVARAAGVSQATASRALSGAPRVSEATRRAVEAAAERLGYVRDLRAADLASARRTTLGLLIRGAERSFYGELAAAIQRQTGRLDIDLLIVGAAGGETAQIQAINTLLGHGAGGILIASGRASERAVEYAAGFVPTVTISLGLTRPKFDAVNIAHASETELADRVADAGHRHVAVTASQDPDAFTLHARTASFITQLVVRGAQTTVTAGPSRWGTQIRDALRTAIDSGATAIMTGDDAMALRVLEYLQEWGIRCPDDVSVTGFDGVGPYLSSVLGLTTVAQPVEELARHAVELVQERLDGFVGPAVDLRVPGRFVPGRTLGRSPS
ncbi:DNA-binding LacI/PurR family transcriptional regulator [Microbacterium sp. W4I4]|uniref:LacI family DNA-binding transcriptional regulator n=1 Tax=Microbacterium sp. W4I4 TaxID=3042295 RepID=UPI002789F72F|nr:LacI family DNA-binding transcriptional regulator [Microbacterium sp. W4I4]MDQ0615178.1 DNA-binding LacI/PurR family transcriptional regulator [Microbacterium sp. W4I4]